jgi:hypothetical protein
MRIIRGEYHAFKRMSRAHITKENEEEGVVLLCSVQLAQRPAPGKTRIEGQPK